RPGCCRTPPPCRLPRRPALRRTEAQARAVTAVRRDAPDLAARRAASLARCAIAQAARGRYQEPPRGWRHCRGGEPHGSQDQIRAQGRAQREAEAMKAALALLARDVTLAWREGGTVAPALGFYLVVVAITPLGLGPDLNLLARIAPGMLWIALLLAALFSADSIFHNDYEDAALDALTTGPLPLPLVAAVKSLAHWLTTGVAPAPSSPRVARFLPTSAAGG